MAQPHADAAYTVELGADWCGEIYVVCGK